MSTAIVSQATTSSNDREVKAGSLSSAERDFRLAKFATAYRACKEHVKSPTFQQLNDRKKHETVKAFILYAHHNHRCDHKGIRGVSATVSC